MQLNEECTKIIKQLHIRDKLGCSKGDLDGVMLELVEDDNKLFYFTLSHDFCIKKINKIRRVKGVGES